MTATKNLRTPPRFLVLSGSYSTLSLAFCRSAKFIFSHTAENVRASAQLLPLIEQHLLIPAQSTIHDIDFIAVDAGPGAFTSLRVLLATVNGLGLAVQKPIVSCDGIAVLGQELVQKNTNAAEKRVLFNAYNNEVYFHNPTDNTTTYVPLQQAAALLNEYAQPVALAGQGIGVYEQQLREAGVNLTAWQQEMRYPSLQALAENALLQWDKIEQFVYEAKPLHLKEQRFKKLSR
ncbi:MAG: tRNA (adenosine(37)-N6)-threonylcarbamoyltransferase complex dimerization subunit type 1 TsaB [Candidatus Dependentiae bacterium]